MKKNYHSPTVYFESFELSATIAANCAQKMVTFTDIRDCVRTGTQSDPKHGCTFYDNGYQIFLSSTCAVYPVNDYIGNLCYHVPTETGKMFIS